MKKLLIVNDGLSGGGIRQALINLLENLQGENYEVDLLLFRDSEKAENQINNEKIRFCKEPFLMNIYSTSVKTFVKKKYYMRAICGMFLKALVRIVGARKVVYTILTLTRKTKKYDIAISFSNDIWKAEKELYVVGVNDYVSKCVNADKKISWVHNDPYQLGFTNQICLDTYKKFDKVVNVSYACKNMFDEIIPEYKYKSEVVYNMFDLERVSRLSKKANPYEEELFHIVTVARLANQQKRIDRIIRCCEKLKNEGAKKFQWHIVGDGPDKDLLEALSKEKGTDDVLFFEGRQNNPYPYMKYADIFMQSSDYEAYSMVLTEALSVGTPIICTNYPSAKEIILDGKNGILTDLSEESICSTILKVMSEENILRDMRKYISQNKVSNERCLEQFNNVIRGI